MATQDQTPPTTAEQKRRLSEAKSRDDSISSAGQQTLNGAPTIQQLEHGQQLPPGPWWPNATYGPLSRYETTGERLPAFGGEFQPGLYKPPKKNIANPAPLGLAAFAMTTFLLSLINLGTRGLGEPNLVVGPAFAYGGLCQLLAGMWEIAYGNTFGGWALGSYGGFWLSFGIIFTPGGFDIAGAYGGANEDFYSALGLYILGWFIFTFLVWIMTLKSTVAFNSLFLTVWLTFLCLGVGYLNTSTVAGVTSPHAGLNKAGGAFGIIAGFIAWWNMLAGLLEPSNSFFLIPVLHFPWSDKGKARRASKAEGDVEKNA